MHDTLKLEEKGIPAVALIHDRFEMAARSQAKMLGVPALKIVSISELQPDEPDSELPKRIDRVWSQITGALTKQ